MPWIYSTVLWLLLQIHITEGTLSCQVALEMFCCTVISFCIWFTFSPWPFTRPNQRHRDIWGGNREIQYSHQAPPTTSWPGTTSRAWGGTRGTGSCHHPASTHGNGLHSLWDAGKDLNQQCVSRWYWVYTVTNDSLKLIIKKGVPGNHNNSLELKIQSLKSTTLLHWVQSNWKNNFILNIL